MTGYIATDIIDQFTQLDKSTDNDGPSQTHALLSGSPAIDTGDNTIAAGLNTDYAATRASGVLRWISVHSSWVNNPEK